jgi:hypothetical protein
VLNLEKHLTLARLMYVWQLNPKLL